MFASYRMSWVAQSHGDFMKTRLWDMCEHAPRFTVGSQSLRGLLLKLMVVHMCVSYSRFGTSQSQRRTRPRNYIREMTQILRALHGQTF